MSPEDSGQEGQNPIAFLPKADTDYVHPAPSSGSDDDDSA
jgi:hypothetical protein